MTSGFTIRFLLTLCDPRLRFEIGGNLESVGAILKRKKIPGDCGAPIYCLLEDDLGRVCIGIAQDANSGIPADEWISEQLQLPIMRSTDTVDLLGNVIPSPDGIGG